MRNEQESLKTGLTTTLDESIGETISRDWQQIVDKLKVVLVPLNQQDSTLEKLKEWDLWGPLLVCLLLSCILGMIAPAEAASTVFAVIFVVVWCGAAAVTLNAQLLGGTISFFQSVCILGYCVFPLTLAALGAAIVDLMVTSMALVRLAIVGVGFVWSTKASFLFMEKVCGEKRKVLAVYPVFLFYTFLAWIILVTK